jgi:hypothetical protein
MLGLARRVLTRLLLALLIVGALTLAVGVASAREVLQGDVCTIEADEVIEGNLFVLCRDLSIWGHVDGNIMGAVTNAVITDGGIVDGGIYLLANKLDIYGTVGENLHFVGSTLNIHRAADFTDQRADLMSVSLSTTIESGAELPGSIIGAGYQMVIAGRVRDEIDFWGSALKIDGNVGGAVTATVGSIDSQGGWLLDTLLRISDVDIVNPGLRVAESARLDGLLTYTSPSMGEIDGALAEDPLFIPAARPNLAQIELMQDEAPVQVLNLYFSQVVREFISLALVGMIGLFFIPRPLQAPLSQLNSRPLTSLGIGMLSFILWLVIVVVLIILSVIILVLLWLLRLNDMLLGVGVILGLIDLGSASLFIMTAFVARVVVCLALGRMIVRLLLGDDGSQRILYLSLFVGVALLSLTASLPIIGWIFNGVSLFVGFGAILIILRTRVEQIRETAPIAPPRYTVTLPPLLPRQSEEARQFPPPMIDDATRPPGMDNLPEGFQFWED